MGVRAPILAVLFVASIAPAVHPAEPFRIHPESSKYFLFRGRPLVLLTATEHYGSVLNRNFNFKRYLRDAAEKKITLTRTFLLFRELQSVRNPYSPLKTDSPDFVAPYSRTGPGKALDGEPIFDLDQWNPEYFERLHTFLQTASDLGVVVELTLFSNSYGDSVWAMNPLRAENNKQKVGNVAWQDYISLKDSDLVTRQLAFARKIVQETFRYDNLYYEICNEPGGGWEGHASLDEIDAWQTTIASVVREELNKVGAKHLIAGQEAFTYKPKFEFPYKKSFDWDAIDIVNVHPLPNTTYRGRSYDLGGFMSKELKLSEVKDFCADVFAEKRPVVLDEDNSASLYRDPVGWTIHRKRAWTALLNGAHYDYIDFSINVGLETGTPESNAKIRTWFQHLSEVMHSFDFIHAKPMPNWAEHDMPEVIASTFGIDGKDYLCYLADAREATDAQSGAPIEGEIAFGLPAGRYAVRLYSPVAGMYSPAWVVEGGKRVSIPTGSFEHDLLIRITEANP